MTYILKRLGYYLLALWASVTLNFLLPRLMPGDPVSRMSVSYTHLRAHET